ncbi:hypothetical protein [Nonomuraea sp. NPDC049480]|uniref:hypothetical protein n=1 Tax=Nonomuraea sp. NPDC049480 TaxID=3364353 RepID=UPI0037990EE2
MVPGFEPPTPGRIARIVASALHKAEIIWSLRTVARLSEASTRRIRALVGLTDDAPATAAATDEPVVADATPCSMKRTMPNCWPASSQRRVT